MQIVCCEMSLVEILWGGFLYSSSGPWPCSSVQSGRRRVTHEKGGGIELILPPVNLWKEKKGLLNSINGVSPWLDFYALPSAWRCQMAHGRINPSALVIPQRHLDKVRKKSWFLALWRTHSYVNVLTREWQCTVQKSNIISVLGPMSNHWENILKNKQMPW